MTNDDPCKDDNVGFVVIVVVEGRLVDGSSSATIFVADDGSANDDGSAVVDMGAPPLLFRLLPQGPELQKHM
jgi:hypothetical protein